MMDDTGVKQEKYAFGVLMLAHAMLLIIHIIV